MATIVHTLGQGAKSASRLSTGTLASGTYVASSAFDLGANVPVALTIQASGMNANGTPSGNKQLVLFAKWSLDNSVFTSGPESGTTATEEADLHFIGAVPMNDTNDHAKEFVVYPRGRYMKIIAKNDLGVALSSGGEIYTAAWTGESN